MAPRTFRMIVLVAYLAAAARADAACTAAAPMANVPESTPTSAFVDHGNGTVTHTLTGLMWKRCAEGRSGDGCLMGAPALLSWTDAHLVALNDTSGGHTDWRVPNFKELASIVETCGHNPASNMAIFPTTVVTSAHWTSTTVRGSPSSAYTVSFLRGITNTAGKTAPLAVRLVRSGNAPSGGFDSRHIGAIDVDGDGKADPLTDGVLIVRYLFGLRGTALIDHAVAAGAQRTTAEQIESFLRSVLPSQ